MKLAPWTVVTVAIPSRAAIPRSTTSGGSRTSTMLAMQDRDGAQRASPPGKRGWAALFAAPEFYRERREAPPTGFEAVFEPVVLLAAISLFSLGAIQFGLAVAP